LNIQKEITIEELVAQVPESISYLMKKGIKCLACGEPIWGTLESASKEKGFDDELINVFVNDLNNLINKKFKGNM
jgi:methionine synthase II (cobalamin-independent)